MASSTAHAAHSSERVKLPEGAWDSHVHVIDEARYPFRPDYHYRPKTATLDDLLRFENGLGVANFCLVALSIYGTDNRSMLDVLRQYQGRGRAVVTIDPLTVTDNELAEMHQLGARAVRLNLASKSQELSKKDFVEILHAYAKRLRPLSWALQLYIKLPQVAIIADEIAELGIPVIIDHLAHPSQASPMAQQHGYADFVSLLERRLVYTKLSGTYRYEGLPDLSQVVRHILRVAPTQVVWASDWPHTGGGEHNPNGDRTIHQDFRPVNDAGFVAQCLEWCDGDQDLAQKIWVDNPSRLWQV